MAKQLHMALGSEHHVPKVMPSVRPLIQGGMGAKFLRFATALLFSIGGRRRKPAVQSYIPRKSREEDSRLEFEKFLYW